MSDDNKSILPARSPGGMFWLQRLWRSNAFTITLSVALHGSVFLAFYNVAFRQQREPRRLIIPEARLAPLGGASGGQPGETSKANPKPAAPPIGHNNKTATAGAAAAGSPLPLSELPVLAVNLTGNPDLVVGDPEGAARGSTGLAGVSLMGASYGGGGTGGEGGAIGPATSFFGVAGNAYKVVYLVDVSNSLMTTLDRQIIAEMKRAIQDLTASQQFHVILATPMRLIEFGTGRLVYATAANKQAAMKFIETNVHMTQDLGAHAPVEGIRRAFDIQPELIYFVSDGDFILDDERAALKSVVAEKSPHGEIKLTTLGFGNGDRKLLEQLARQTGGNFRYTDYK